MTLNSCYIPTVTSCTFDYFIIKLKTTGLHTIWVRTIKQAITLKFELHIGHYAHISSYIRCSMCRAGTCKIHFVASNYYGA